MRTRSRVSPGRAVPRKRLKPQRPVMGQHLAKGRWAGSRRRTGRRLTCSSRLVWRGSARPGPEGGKQIRNMGVSERCSQSRENEERGALGELV
jgi:hypothetical protein